MLVVAAALPFLHRWRRWRQLCTISSFVRPDPCQQQPAPAAGAALPPLLSSQGMAAVLLPLAALAPLQLPPAHPLVPSPACQCTHLCSTAELCPLCPPTLTLPLPLLLLTILSTGIPARYVPTFSDRMRMRNARANVTPALKVTRARGRWKKSSMWGGSNEGINQSALQTKERTSQGVWASAPGVGDLGGGGTGPA